MKVSISWLQSYFDAKLPPAEELAELLTFHTAEIEEVTPEYLDVKVLPDRASYMLCHRGVAKEFAALLNLPLKQDPLLEPVPAFTETSEITLSIATPNCNRHMGALVKGVKVGPSPEWLSKALEDIGQRSINNIVDATNYVTFNIGQPLHAFDAKKIGKLNIGVRDAKEGEEVQILSGEVLKLPATAMVIIDGDDQALDIAGIKGGAASGITDETTYLFISVANFDGTKIRKTAQALKLWTDASLRFQNRISPELVPFGMRDILELITQIAGGEVVGVNDMYPNPVSPLQPVSVSLSRINGKLGSSYSLEEVKSVFDRLQFSYTVDGEVVTVTPTFERKDIAIPDDLIEEVGRVIGYEKIPATPLSSLSSIDQHAYHGLERIRDFLLSEGFTEISTQSFAEKGDILLSNPLQEHHPYLRTDLKTNMEEALSRATTVALRVLGPQKELKLFEIGNVFTKQGEEQHLVVGYKVLEGKKKPLEIPSPEFTSLWGDTLKIEEIQEWKLEEQTLKTLGEGYIPTVIKSEMYTPFSLYPSAIRDIAVWTPKGTTKESVEESIKTEAGELLARIDLFDSFEKEERVSYAFRLIFESFEKTLSDADINPIMDRVTLLLNGKEGFMVR